MRNIKYQTPTGANVEIAVEAQYGLNLQGCRKSTGRKTVSVTSSIDGKRQYSPLGVEKLNPERQGFVAKIGRLGVSQSLLTQIQQMIDEENLEIAAENKVWSDREARLDALGTGDINHDFGDHC